MGKYERCDLQNVNYARAIFFLVLHFTQATQVMEICGEINDSRTKLQHNSLELYKRAIAISDYCAYY
jgi:hypothetical protein